MKFYRIVQLLSRCCWLVVITVRIIQIERSFDDDFVYMPSAGGGIQLSNEFPRTFSGEAAGDEHPCLLFKPVSVGCFF